jgi:hypothetical protein
MKSRIIRISLALLFCLGMFVTANPVALGQRDRDRDRDRGGHKRCQKECKERYDHQKRECKDRRGRERRECQQRADREQRECKERCRH